MPSINPRRRSRVVYEEDDDDAEPSPSTSGSSKRRKSGTNNHITEEEEEEEGQSEEDEQELSDDLPAPSNRQTEVKEEEHNSTNGNTPGPGQFHPGAIVRVRVDNFVTYEHAEFLPGPNLNMVIGPNGTGKSSLVCAICLGLGYHPKHLGRASHVGEFVKHGQDSATIEVELQKRPKDRANPIIRVQINREDNSRKWWLNGRESSHKAVQELTRSLRIQIDNLCQFLPQDKVAEFAGLTPTRLLEETLRAAAPEEVLNWQSRLKTLHKEHREMKAKVETCSDTLKGHESRQQGVQADVDRLREREAIQQKVEQLRGARAVVEYEEKRRKFGEAKKRGREAREKLRDLESAGGPALEAVNQKRAYRAQIEPVVERRRRALRIAENAAEQSLRKIEAYDEDIETETNSIETEKKVRLQIKNEITRKRTTITNLEAKLKDKPPEFVPSDWNTKIVSFLPYLGMQCVVRLLICACLLLQRQKESILQEIQGEHRSLAERFDELKASNVAKRNTLDNLKKEHDNLNSQQGKKLTQLKNTSADAAKGWEWLQENLDQFEKEVFGPPMLSCSITDKRYSDQVQSLLALDDFICFTCQTPGDHKKLSTQFNRTMGIAVPIRTCTSDYTSFRPGIPRNQLREYGLDAYAIEFLEGPDPVLAMLCSEKKLHISAVALRDISNTQFEQIVASETISSWAAGTRLYRVARRREYGPGATSTSTRTLRPGRFWTDQPVDETERADIERRMREIEEELRKYKLQGQDFVRQRNTLKDRTKEIEEEIVGPVSFRHMADTDRPRRIL